MNVGVIQHWRLWDICAWLGLILLVFWVEYVLVLSYTELSVSCISIMCMISINKHFLLAAPLLLAVIEHEHILVCIHNDEKTDFYVLICETEKQENLGRWESLKSQIYMYIKKEQTWKFYQSCILYRSGNQQTQWFILLNFKKNLIRFYFIQHAWFSNHRVGMRILSLYMNVGLY